MKKIIFLDVDGTLVNYQNEVPKSAVQAIQTARQKGHKVFICTGRSRAEVSSDLWDIGLDGMIGGNGSYVEYNNRVLMHQLIPEQTAHKVVDWLNSRGLEFYLESNNGLFASRNFREIGKITFHQYMASKSDNHMKNEQIIDTLLNDMIWNANLYRDDLNKVSFILNSYQDYLDAKVAFPELKAGTWGGVGETALFGDLGVKDIDKGYAISVLLEHLGESQEDTFAFGDAKIDIPMLEYCAVGIAMGNGGDEIKAMADFVTDDVDNDGLYKAFEKFGLL